MSNENIQKRARTAYTFVFSNEDDARKFLLSMRSTAYEVKHPLMGLPGRFDYRKVVITLTGSLFNDAIVIHEARQKAERLGGCCLSEGRLLNHMP